MKVIQTEHLSESAGAWLATQVELVKCPHEEVARLQGELAEAAGLVVRTYTEVNDALLDFAPKLKVVARAGVGLDNVDLEACSKRGVKVVYTPDANTQAVVEYLWALILDALRPRVYMEDYVPPTRFHEMRGEYVGTQLNTMTLGILGMGRIGRRIAKVAHAMGIRVIYNDLLTRRELKLDDEDMAEFVDKATLYERSDILTIHVDGRKENHQLIDGEAFGQLKRSCTLLNTSRGFVIDVPALGAWAKDVVDDGGQAILDVHDPEPPADDYALFGLKNVKLLPHLASRTYEAMDNMSWVVRDVVRVLNGEEAKYPAN